MKLNGKEYLFHVGQQLDTNGRKKDLIIREGKVGIWKDLQVHEDSDTDEVYYEVVVNRKVTSLVLETVNGKQTATAQELNRSIPVSVDAHPCHAHGHAQSLVCLHHEYLPPALRSRELFLLEGD